MTLPPRAFLVLGAFALASCADRAPAPSPAPVATSDSTSLLVGPTHAARFSGWVPEPASSTASQLLVLQIGASGSWFLSNRR